MPNGVGIISSIKIIKPDDSRNILLPIDIVVGLIFVQFLEIGNLIDRLQVEFNIIQSMRYHLIVIRKAIYFSCIQVDEKMVVMFNAVLICRSWLTLALIVFAAYQTSEYVIVGERYAANLLEIEIYEMPFYCCEVGALGLWLF